MKDMAELVEDFADQNKIHSFEGTTGVKNLEKIIEAIGYSGNGFRHGSIIECFLADNPAACEALVDFIKSADVEEWRESLEFCVEDEDEVLT